MPDREGGDSDIQSGTRSDENEAGDVDVHAEVHANVIWKDFKMTTRILEGDVDQDDEDYKISNNKLENPGNLAYLWDMQNT